VTDTRFSVVHRTEYRYARPMSDGYTVAHLLPRDTLSQRVEEARLEIVPDVDAYDDDVDVFGNRVVRLGVHHAHDHLVITSRSVVALATEPLERLRDRLGTARSSWEDVAAAVEALRGEPALDVSPFTAAVPATPVTERIRAYARTSFVEDRSLVDAVRDLCHRINVEFEFDPGFSTVWTPVEEVLDARRGVCQDFAHLMLACLRSCGLAARYVSGYIETDPPPGEEKLAGSDASHAWCSVWSPDVGWFDVDPTNDQMPTTRHVTVGWGRDYADVAPVHGVVIGPPAEQTLLVGVDVTRLG